MTTTTTEVGTSVNQEQALLLPAGTMLNDLRGRAWTILESGFMILTNTQWGSATEISDMGSQSWEVTRMGRTPTVNSQQETLAQFKQRFRTVAYGSANNNGSDYLRVAVPALERLGLDATPPIGRGMWLAHGDSPLSQRLSDQARVLGLGGPNHWESYVRVSRGSVTDGYCQTYPSLVRVKDTQDGDTDEWLGVGTDDDKEQIAAFKSEVWQAGWELKRNHSWCGAFEAAMSLVGISERSVITVSSPVVTTSAQHGTVVSRDVAREFPEGAIFMYPNTGVYGPGYQGWCWMVRDNDNSHGTVRTRHLFGSNTGHFNESDHLVVWNGTDPMRIPANHVAMDAAPVGTQVTAQFQPYTKRADGRWVCTGEGHPTSRFREGEYYFTLIPGVNDQPQADPVPLAVGMEVGVDQMMGAPLGTVIHTMPDPEPHVQGYVKRENGWGLTNGGGSPYGPDRGSVERGFGTNERNGWFITRLGGGPEVGSLMVSNVDMDLAPVGSVIGYRGNSPDSGHVKEDDGRWVMQGMSNVARHPSSDFQENSHWYFLRIGSVMPEVGMRATPDLMMLAPVGTNIGTSVTDTGYAYTKRENGDWAVRPDESPDSAYGPDRERIEEVFGNDDSWVFTYIGNDNLSFP